MKSFLRILYQPYKWLIFFPVLIIDTLIIGTLATLTAFVSPKWASYFGVIWARINAFLTPMILRVQGREHIAPRQSYVIVSNHQSHYDIFVLYGWLGIDFKWVMKMELRKVPALGLACDKIGHIYIDRKNTEAAIRTIREARRRIVNGTSVIFFPEGTRSRTGSLGRFKKGAFKMALDLNIPILPVTITGTRDILPPKTLHLFPGKARMVIHPPVDVSDYDESRIRELMDRCREIIDPERLPD